MADSDEILAAWRKIETNVRAVAEQCRADPIEAEVTYGIRLDHHDSDTDQRTFGGERFRPPQNDRAAWLRATATKLIPRKFQWAVMETFGGGAALVLKSVDSDLDLDEGDVSSAWRPD